LKVARFFNPERIEIIEEPVPEISPGEVLLRVEACGLCGTDLFKLKKGAGGKVLGHEISGVVEETKGNTGFSQGDRVFVAHHIPCFLCHHCRRGNFSLCSLFQSTNIHPGGFSQYIRIPTQNVEKGMIKLSPTISFDEATLIEPFACVWRNLKRLSPLPDDEILIIGAGPAGIMHLHLLKLKGIEEIDIMEIKKERKKFAEKFHPRKVLSPHDMQEKKYDICVVCAGSTQAIEEGLKRLKKGGKLSIFAQVPEGSSIQVDPNLIYFETTFLGTYSSSPIEQREIYNLMKMGKIKGKDFITHTFPLSRIKEAVNLALEGRDSLKIIIHPQK